MKIVLQGSNKMKDYSSSYTDSDEGCRRITFRCIGEAKITKNKRRKHRSLSESYTTENEYSDSSDYEDQRRLRASTPKQHSKYYIDRDYNYIDVPCLSKDLQPRYLPNEHEKSRIDGKRYHTLHVPDEDSWGMSYKNMYELPTVSSALKAKHPVFVRYRDEISPRREKSYRGEKSYRREKSCRREKSHRGKTPCRTEKPYRKEKSYRGEKSSKERKPYREVKSDKEDRSYKKEKKKKKNRKRSIIKHRRNKDLSSSTSSNYSSSSSSEYSDSTTNSESSSYNTSVEDSEGLSDCSKKKCYICGLPLPKNIHVLNIRIEFRCPFCKAKIRIQPNK